MKKKTIIELFIYVIVVVVGVVLLLTSKSDIKPIKMNSDFKVSGQRGSVHVTVPVQQSEH